MLNTKICFEQIKTVMRYCYTPIINRIKTDHGKLRMWSNWEPSYTDGEYVNCATILKNSLAVSLKAKIYLPWRRQWHPTPILLPGKSQGWRSLVGCSPWGC